MTGRDRIVLLVVVVAVLLGGVYLKVVSPERKQAAKLATEVSAANSQLSTTESQLASARNAQSSYASAYASVVELGKAVPPAPEVPALIFQLDLASHGKNVDFNSISNATSSTGSSSGSGAGAGATGQAGAPTTFTQLPFTFGFEGGFQQLSSLLETVEGFTKSTSSGSLQITGRLLTIQSLKLAPATSAVAGGKVSSTLTGTITATAYVLPVSQGSTATSSTGATPASTSASTSSSPTTPAVVRVTP